MTVFSAGGLSGFDSTPVELAAELLWVRKGYMAFNDGIATRCLPLEYVRWNPQKHTVTLPSWLEKRTRKGGSKQFGIAQKKSIRFRKWSSGKRKRSGTV